MSFHFKLKTHFSMSWKADLVVVNSLNFCLSGKVFIISSFLKDSFTKQGVVGGHFFLPFSTLIVSPCSLLTVRFLLGNPLITLWGILYKLHASFLLLLLRSYFCLWILTVLLQYVLEKISLRWVCLQNYEFHEFEYPNLSPDLGSSHLFL